MGIANIASAHRGNLHAELPQLQLVERLVDGCCSGRDRDRVQPGLQLIALLRGFIGGAGTESTEQIVTMLARLTNAAQNAIERHPDQHESMGG